MTVFNDRIIAEFRANRGRVDSAGFGSTLLLLHSIGARTGDERVNPAMSVRDGDGWLVVASAKGAARDPAWAHNLRAHPDITVEAHVAGEQVAVPVSATELTGYDHDVAFARFVARAPAFAGYQRRAASHRQLPVFRLTPRAAIGPGDPAGAAPERSPHER